MSAPYRFDLNNYLDNEVYPRLFERADAVFPDYGFLRRGNHWENTRAVGDSEPKKVWLYRATPWHLFDHKTKVSRRVIEVLCGANLRGADFIRALSRLAEQAGVAPPDWQTDPDALARFEQAHRREGLLDSFLDVCRKYLLGDNGSDARAYLATRGFAELEAVELGLVPPGAELARALNVLGFEDREIEKSHVLKLGEGRIVGPGRGPSGRIDTFWGRALRDDVAKYKYLEGHPKPAAFGLNVALREGGRDNLVLVEGVMDPLLLQPMGLLNVAAIGGASISSKNLEALGALGVKRVTLCLDYDKSPPKAESKGASFPGLRGSLEAIENAIKVDKVGKVPIVYVVPPESLREAMGTGEFEKVDPDSLVRAKGLGALRGVLEEAVPGLAFLASVRVNEALGEVTPSSPKAARYEAAHAALGALEGIDGKGAYLAREVGLQDIAFATGFTLEAVTAEREGALERLERKRLEGDLKAVGEDIVRRLSGGEPGHEVLSLVKPRLDGLALKSPDVELSFLGDMSELARETKALPASLYPAFKGLREVDVTIAPGQLILAGGRPGHGKTSFLLSFLLKCLEQNKDDHFLFYSLEEPPLLIGHRLVSQATKGSKDTPISSKDVMRLLGPEEGTMEEFRALSKAMSELSSLGKGRYGIHYVAGWSADAIAAHAREVCSQHKVAVVFVDYLQRVAPPPGKYDRRDQEVTAAGRELKKLAVLSDLTVIAGAQMGRDGAPDANISGDFFKKLQELRKGRPLLKHLREGGSEQEADIVLGLFNPRADFDVESTGEENDNPNSNALEVTVYDVGVLKNRYGRVGQWTQLAFDSRRAMVRDLDSPSELKKLLGY